MVLLIMTADRTQLCARAIEKQTGEVVQVAADGTRGAVELRRQEYSVIVVEECIWESDKRLPDAILAHGGTAALLVVNPAIAGAPRIAAEVATALGRRDWEFRRTREEVERQLRSELKEAVTGILLSAELALAVPALPSRAESKIRAVYDLAMSLRDRLHLAA